LNALLYGAILFIVLKYGARFWVLLRRCRVDCRRAAWASFGGIYAWLHNRPSKVLTPRRRRLCRRNAELVIATLPTATLAEKFEAHALANAASDKVVAKTT